MKKLILLLTLLIFALTLPAQNLKVCTDKKGRCGYANEQGEVVIKCKYDIAFEFENDIAKVSKGGKFGFIDSDGEEILPTDYEEITLWNKGVFRIKSGDKYGLFSITDGILQKPQFTCIGKLNQYGKAIITDGGKNKGGIITGTKIGIINADGEILIKPEYDKISELKDISSSTIFELLLLTDNTVAEDMLFVGTLSKAEQSINEAMKKHAEKEGLEFKQKTGIHPDDTLKTSAEYLCCYKGNKSAITDKKGKVLTPFFKDCKFSIPSSNMCAFRYGKTKITLGYYNMTTKKKVIIGKNIKIKKQLMYSTPFTGDVAVVANVNTEVINTGVNTEKNLSYYFINKSGKKVSEDFFTTLYKGGYWVVTNMAGDKKAMFDGNGKTIMDFGEYIDILPHNNGKLFTVRDNSGIYGVIDKERNTVVPFEYLQLGEPVNGWYWATNKNNKTGIMDEFGNIVVPFEFHNLFMNNSKEVTNIWARKEANGSWYNYSIEKRKIIGEEAINSANYINNYAWMVPKGQKITNNAIHKAFTTLYPKNTEDSYGKLIDKEGNYKTTITIPVELFPTMAETLETNGGTLTPLQEKEIIYKKISGMLKYELSTTIAEEFWNF